MGTGMGWGGACITVPWKENIRTSRHVKRYGDGDGDGVGWGMCYRSMEGEHKDRQTCEEIGGWGRGWGGVGHVLPFHGRRTQGQADM